MPILCVEVKKGKLKGNPDNLSSFVRVILQNVTLETDVDKGGSPTWEQEFVFETNRLDQTLCFQLWEKGFFKDNLLGSAWIPLMQIHHSNEGGSGAWVQLSNETSKGLVSSGHVILVDSRFELPSELSEEEVIALQNKLDSFYTIMSQEVEVLKEQSKKLQREKDIKTVSDELDSAYSTSDAALYNPFLDSDPESDDRDSDDVADRQISDSEADRVMINYTDHFDGSIGRTSDDILEDLEEKEIEDSVMMPFSELPESEQGDDEMWLEEEETVEVRFVFKTLNE